MKSCKSGKRAFATPEIAEEALIEAHVQYHYGPGEGPVGAYQCEDCGQYHLTSRGPVNERLSDLLNRGEIQKRREANHWAKQIKTRKH